MPPDHLPNESDHPIADAVHPSSQTEYDCPDLEIYPYPNSTVQSADKESDEFVQSD